MSSNKKFEKATMRLGRLYGVADRDSKLSWLDRHYSLDAETFNSYFNQSPLLEIISSFQDKNRRFPSIRNIAKSLSDVCKSQDANNAVSNKEEVNKKIQLTFEAGGVIGVDTPGVNVYTDPKTSGWTQGTPNGLADGGKPKVASINGAIGYGIESNSAGLNANPTAVPTRKNPALSVIQVIDSKDGLDTRNTGASQVFFNAFSTIQLSMAIPYLDVTMIENTPALGITGKVQVMSLAGSALGGRSVGSSQEGPSFIMATAADMRIVRSEIAGRLAKSGKISDNPYLAATEIPPNMDLSTSGMELFCSPQTMGLLDGYSDYSDTLNPMKNAQGEKSSSPATPTPPGGRPQAPLDRFRPLASIESLQVEVKSSVGLISFKTAELSITCFDRSRLHEISPLIRPDKLGKTKIEIAYGWSFPEMNNELSDFLNGIRVREMYIVSNSNYTFTEDGSVKITVQLSMQGGAEFGEITIPENHEVLPAKEAIRKITQAISEIRAGLSGRKSQGKSVGASVFLNSASTTSTALTLDKETKKSLKNFLSRPPKNDPKYIELYEHILTLYGPKGDGGLAKKFNKTLMKSINDKLTSIDVTPDPFLRTIIEPSGGKNKIDYISPNCVASVSTKSSKCHYISLGKLLLSFVGQPIASSGRYEEVQMIYYAFNAKASFVRDFNIAQFPIHKDTFKKAFKAFAKGTGYSMPISSFMNFILKEFVNNPTARPYGMRSMYKVDDDGYQYKKDFKDSVVLSTEIRKRLAAAYGAKLAGPASTTEDLEFKLPRITFTVEAGHMAEEEEDKASDPSPKSVIRIHIYDAQNSAGQSLHNILKAAFSDSMGLIGSVALKATKREGQVDNRHVENFKKSLQQAHQAGIITPVGKEIKGAGNKIDILKTKWSLNGDFATVKRWMAYSLPTIKIGSNNSAVITADVSSNTNSLLSTISLQRANSNNAIGAKGFIPAGMPLQINPMKLNMTTVGNPLFEIGQQFFVDLETGTSADNIYQVHKVSHTLEPGKFESKLDCLNLEAYGTLRASTQLIEDALVSLNAAEENTEAALTNELLRKHQFTLKEAQDTVLEEFIHKNKDKFLQQGPPGLENKKTNPSTGLPWELNDTCNSNGETYTVESHGGNLQWVKTTIKWKEAPVPSLSPFGDD